MFKSWSYRLIKVKLTGSGAAGHVGFRFGRNVQCRNTGIKPIRKRNLEFYY